MNLEERIDACEKTQLTILHKLESIESFADYIEDRLNQLEGTMGAIMGSRQRINCYPPKLHPHSPKNTYIIT